MTQGSSAIATTSADHLAPLPGTSWQVWRVALLRSAGFPADGLDRFAMPECAAVADAYLDGLASEEKLVAAFGEAAERSAGQAREIAVDPLFREAVTWQNRSALAGLDALLRGSGRASRRREKEQLVARYWQRYCGKNETIGFFGPVCWADLDPDPAAPAVTVRAGTGLTRTRRVFFEHWALVAYARSLTADARVRPWLPVRLQPHLWRDGVVLHRPTGAPLRLSRLDACVLAACDGRPAAQVAAAVLANPDSELRKPDDVYLQLDRLVAAGLLRWGVEPLQRIDAEDLLRAAVDAVPDQAAREAAQAGLGRLCAARDAVAGAAGDPAALPAALDRLDAEFEAVTGVSAHRRAGQTYAGRGLCHEEATRDLDVTIGAAVLDAVAAPMEILLCAARWLTVAIADAYTRALADLHADLGGGEVSLGELWFLAQGLLFGAAQRPVDAVAADFARRWSGLFGLAGLPAGTRRVQVAAADVAAAAGEVFAADRPGWAAARLHSPDLHVCAPDEAALRRGDFTVVLGEMHSAWATFDCGVFLWPRPDLPALRDALRADLGAGRMMPLFPDDFPRQSGRLSHWLGSDCDVPLAFAGVPGADPARTLPISALTVVERGGELVARAPDGRAWPLVEAFAGLVAMHAADGFKLVTAAEHTPRVSIDRLVVSRETWRTTLGATPLSSALGPQQRYLAARRWRRELGLPERVYVKIGTEIKPIYLDLTSPTYVSSMCAMARGARESAGPDVPLVVSEMLPTPDQAWVPDAAGRRYFSELRLQLVDPTRVDPMRAGGWR
ncbi:MAG TPA: lantibiotic dehydratase [Micromonosporaceae bacterium]|nr:lantibiotic dehydratase [Micromonosporaceae bacterium]